MLKKHNNLDTPVKFNCQGEQMLGMIHKTEKDAETGVLVIVGGPQYRIGSHRQFILMARGLAAQGIPTMRFDVRGMGDSTGQPRSFQQIDADISAAIDTFLTYCPTLKKILLWGLCDGASAALFYAYQDPRVQGLVLLNPWVFTPQGAAKTYLKHYYLKRLINRQFWEKIFFLKFDYANSAMSLLNLFKQASSKTETAQGTAKTSKIDENLALPTRMRECLRQFAYPVLLILSGRDLTADEFKETVKTDPVWQSLLKENRLVRRDLAEADHTFSSAAWRDQITLWTKEWVFGLEQTC